MRRCFNCMEDYPEEPGLVCEHCGFDNETAEGEEGCLFPGSILQGRYIVGKVRQVRDTDVCYLGWDALFERKVQIQEYLPRAYVQRKDTGEVVCREEAQAAYAEGLEQFYSRSRELIRLYREEDIVTYYACFLENKTAYGIMEYREEKTLEEWLQGKKIGQQDGLYLLQAALKAVEKVHQSGGYHGRICADAFWMTSRGHMILKDFGGFLPASERGCGGDPDEKESSREPEGICLDAWGLAELFLRIVAGKEIRDAEELAAERNQGLLTLSQPVLKVMQDAMAYRVSSLEPFKELDPDREDAVGKMVPSAGVPLQAAEAAKQEARPGKAGGKAKKKWIPWLIGGAVGVLALAAAGSAAFGFLGKQKAAVRDAGYEIRQDLGEEENRGIL